MMYCYFIKLVVPNKHFYISINVPLSHFKYSNVLKTIHPK